MHNPCVWERLTLPSRFFTVLRACVLGWAALEYIRCVFCVLILKREGGGGRSRAPCSRSFVCVSGSCVSDVRCCADVLVRALLMRGYNLRVHSDVEVVYTNSTIIDLAVGVC